jgi:riboflavin-specific deaminase-like protein
MTLDGKLAPASRKFIPFGSKRDHDLLLELRTEADAVMCGARTADLTSINMGPGPEKYRELRVTKGRSEYNLRVVVTGSGTINPQAEIFKHHFSPIILLTREGISKSKIQRLLKLTPHVHAFGREKINFTEALQWLRKEWGVKRLLSEGGGEVNDALFREDLVDEIYVTLTPFILGGRDAPTLADGLGAKTMADATQLKLKQARREKDEIYLVYEALKKRKGRRT